MNLNLLSPRSIHILVAILASSSFMALPSCKRAQISSMEIEKDTIVRLDGVFNQAFTCGKNEAIKVYSIVNQTVSQKESQPASNYYEPDFNSLIFKGAEGSTLLSVYVSNTMPRLVVVNNRQISINEQEWELIAQTIADIKESPPESR